MPDRGRHWDDVYRNKGSEGVSWYQPEPITSLELIRLLDVPPSEAVIDIGGGTSFLVDRLVESGFSDLSVLDVSEVALDERRRRLKDQPEVTFIQHDVLTWRSSRRFGLWHDRAVFSSTDEGDTNRYLATMWDSLEPDGTVVLGSFAEDGPARCAGLPVARYTPTELAGLLGRDFTAVSTRRQIHHTPSEATQPFSWIAAKRSRSPE